MDGEGLKLFRDGGRLPVEIFLAGDGRGAARAYVLRGEDAVKRSLTTAEQILFRLPTRYPAVVAFLTEIGPHFRRDARFYAVLGQAYMQAGDRVTALKNFQRAFELDPSDREVTGALGRLNHLPASVPKAIGWKIPFSLDSVFATPKPSEIRDVERDWATRDLGVKDVHDEATGTMPIGVGNATVRIVSHIVHGSRHYGAIIVPENAKPGCCAVIVEAKGVSWNYFPLDVEGVASPRMMGDMSDRFIYVIPSFRGEVLNFNGKTYTSEGDRRDALDGATDDAIALLNVALATTPNADSGRICTYGQSRGGTVALLLGIRDKSIKCVVDLAGPTDWFYLMGTQGWTEQELWAEAIRTRAKPNEPGGQNVERFLSKALNGQSDLAAVRHNMIASSPLYFATRLPQAQLHYGIEDPFVPVRNGREFVSALQRQRVPKSRYTAFFYPEQGHDTDRLRAPAAAKKFILEVLGVR